MNKYLKPIGIYVLIFVVILAALAYTGPQILPQRNDAAQEEYVYSDLLKELTKITWLLWRFPEEQRSETTVQRRQR